MNGYGGQNNSIRESLSFPSGLLQVVIITPSDKHVICVLNPINAQTLHRIPLVFIDAIVQVLAAKHSIVTSSFSPMSMQHAGS